MLNRNAIELTTLTQEAAELSTRSSLTKVEQRRFNFLTGTAIPAVRSGATLTDVAQMQLNAEELRLGLQPTRLSMSPIETRAKASYMKKLFDLKHGGNSRAIEFRAGEAEGNLLSQIGTYSGLGQFVPTAFYADVFAAMAIADPLLNDDVVTMIYSEKANPMHIGSYDDIANVAVQINEAADETGNQVLLGNPGGVKLGAYSFRTPIHKESMEIYEDQAALGNAYNLFAKFAGNRMSRGISAKMINGTGGGTQTQGILAALTALSVTGVTATGSANNTGGAETGTTTIGSADIASLYFQVNEAYRQSPKCVFVMNDSTMQYLATLVTKQGLPLVSFTAGIPTIMGKRVCVSPSMPVLGASNVVVLFGDFSYWCSRIVTDDLTRIRVLKETYVEQGLIGFQMFMRADGVLAYTGAASHSPISFLQNHS
jgi:HK97 family phage major capsid protein